MPNFWTSGQKCKKHKRQCQLKLGDEYYKFLIVHNFDREFHISGTIDWIEIAACPSGFEHDLVVHVRYDNVYENDRVDHNYKLRSVHSS